MRTHLFTVAYSEPLETAAILMKRHHIRHLPVVNEEGFVVGIISDRDILRASVPVYDGSDDDSEKLYFVQGALVRDYMSTTIKVISVDDKVDNAIEIMLREKVSSCLVVKEDVVVGIITYEDLMELLKAYLNRPTGGSLRATIAGFIASTPLGGVSNFLANVGI